MKIPNPALIAATLTFVGHTIAIADDFHAEVVEWVIEPCMEVAAALDVKSMKEEDLGLGIKREHVAELMVASRGAAIRDLSSKMKASASWDDRSTAYPIMLKYCLGELPGMK